MVINLVITAFYFGGAVALGIHATEWAGWRASGTDMENTIHGLYRIVPSVGAESVSSCNLLLYLCACGLLGCGSLLECLVLLGFPCQQKPVDTRKVHGLAIIIKVKYANDATQQHCYTVKFPCVKYNYAAVKLSTFGKYIVPGNSHIGPDKLFFLFCPLFYSLILTKCAVYSENK